MSLADDMDPNKAYGGIEKLWVLPANHPFNRWFQLHDQNYDLAREGKIVGSSSEAIDITLLNGMLSVAGDDRSLRLQAYFFYDMARAWGTWFWPDAAKPKAKRKAYGKKSRKVQRRKALRPHKAPVRRLPSRLQKVVKRQARKG